MSIQTYPNPSEPDAADGDHGAGPGLGGCGPEGRLDALMEDLRRDGVRRTTGRTEVLRILAAAEGHLHVGEISRRIKATGSFQHYSTTCRNLAMLAERGIVHVVSSNGEAAYGLAVNAHHHAVCEGCGDVAELPDAAMTAATTAAEAATGYRLAPGGLQVTGLCPACQDR